MYRTKNIELHYIFAGLCFLPLVSFYHLVILFSPSPCVSNYFLPDVHWNVYTRHRKYTVYTKNHVHDSRSPVFLCGSVHDDVIKWKYFPIYWPFVRGIHRSPVNSPHKGQWRVALMFSSICAWMNGCVNNREAGDLRHHRAHYDVTIMVIGNIPYTPRSMHIIHVPPYFFVVQQWSTLPLSLRVV